MLDKYDGEVRPVIHGGGKRNGSNTLFLNKVSYIEVNNLELTNTVPSGNSYAATGIRVNGGTDIAIKNCYIHDVNAAFDGKPNFVKATGGIIIDGTVSNVLVQSCHIANSSVTGIRTTGTATNVLFDDNLLEYIYGDGIIMAGATGGCKITHNTVYKACMNTTNYNYAGIWTVKSKNTVVAYNEVYGLTGGGANDGMAFDADGYDANSPTNGDIFEYNYSHDNNGGFMLFMYNSQNITVRYNVSVNDIGTTGKKKLFLFNGSTNRNHQIYNNVFYIKNPGGTIFHSAPYGTYSNNIFMWHLRPRVWFWPAMMLAPLFP
ncbi:right-handed parallel beta-helix repeat-containing protein [Sphingobacterium sp. E70]|uniref:right-handed parallel beta-helix repeat-containing protein n=1 Tax=Sphingobacterium sp. E70 TaxID=2853439 RepID=UPI00211D0297|nr:right-handed parallel beta-helix repeat-containing protein [Sphingobacterium sp. E70]ULT27298.1 right-handed parallel beta-helix repeat-containing protein [Sphingobacterium sp. E70]